jgi:hypothetical protein
MCVHELDKEYAHEAYPEDFRAVGSARVLIVLSQGPLSFE